MSTFFISSNFMVNDIFGISLAALLMPLFMLIPGYVSGWLFDIFQFRSRRGITRLLLAIVLSISIFPSLIYLISKFSSFDNALLFYAFTWCIFLWIIIFKDRGLVRLPGDKWVRIALLLTLAWVIVAIFSLADIQVGQKVYANMVASDHETRIALADAIFRTGIPPANPHIYPGKPLPVSYFYFWSIFPALLSRLTRGFIDARLAFYACIIWTGIALRSIAALYLRFQSPEKGKAVGLRSAISTGLFFISGLDILMVLALLKYFPGNPFIVEWWNGNSLVQSFTSASLWVPHHVSGLIAGITGILIFNSIQQKMPLCQKIVLILLTAISLASLAGLSTYLAFMFVCFWTLYFIASLVVKKWRNQIPFIIAVGIISLLISIPYLRDTFASRQSYSTGSALFVFEVRRFAPLYWAYSSWSLALQNLFSLALLPINYFIELGFFFAAGLYYLQSIIKDKKNLVELHGVDLLLLVTGGVICTFFRSTIITNNDVGWRGFMLVQFILLLWGVNGVISLWNKQFSSVHLAVNLFPSISMQKVMKICIVIGLASVVFELVDLRFYSLLDEQMGWAAQKTGIENPQWGKRNFALREGFQYIYTHYPENAIVQNNPEIESILRAQGLYGLRQTAAAGKDYSFIYGDALNLYGEVSRPFLPIFKNPALNFLQIEEMCRLTKINVLVVKDLDPIWNDSESWVWKIIPDYANDYLRIFSCGESNPPKGFTN